MGAIAKARKEAGRLMSGPIPTPTVGQRYLLGRTVYEVRTVSEGSAVLFPAFEARKSAVHLTWRALAEQGELVTTQPRTGG